MSKELDKKKYENSVLYFVEHCNNNYLGATKLNKLLYYLDFISYRDRGKTITGDLYIHKDFGPVPDTVDEIIAELKDNKKIETTTTECKGSFKVKFKAIQKTDISFFDNYEQKLLKGICREFALWSTAKIVSQTHLEAPWFYSKPYDFVDFNYSKDIEFMPTS
ncbi:MAG: Panacea domain-containing protein [Patescibacteria group bacterium]|nr:Panacea domain-containing protein [Patescibacteria group bacterium]